MNVILIGNISTFPDNQLGELIFPSPTVTIGFFGKLFGNILVTP
jgi:hypothetical protein